MARVRASPPHAFVDVVTLRRADYDQLSAQLKPLSGTVFQTGTQPLAPTRSFARALLGTVGPFTAELLAQRPGRYQPGQLVGLSGLEQQYDEQLAGTPASRVRLRHAPPTAGEVTLLDVAGKAGQPVQTTLDARVQQAADGALAGQAKPSALVAVRVSTGDVLAVANGPGGGSADLALDAQARRAAPSRSSPPSPCSRAGWTRAWRCRSSRSSRSTARPSTTLRGRRWARCRSTPTSPGRATPRSSRSPRGWRPTP